MGNQYQFKKRVLKLGKSTAITLPPVWMRANDVKAGDDLIIEIQAEKLVISVEN